jgi:hypothetical protein
MRKWFASLAVLGLSAVATAQTIPVPPVGGLGQSQSILFDDGSASTSWKVFYPTGAGDAFSVDIDQMATGMDVTGVALNTWQSTSTGPIGIKYVAMAPDNIIDSLGHTPDLNAAVSMLGSLSGTVTITGNPNVAAGFCPGFVGYDLPNVTLGTGGFHAVTTCLTGDSGTWLCSDSSAPDGRSYFSQNNYSSVATSLGGHDLMVRVIGQIALTPGAGPSAYMTVNNATGTVDVDQTGFLSATLWSACAIQPTLYIQGVQIPSYPFLQVPPVILATGYENGSPIADSKQGTVGDFLSDPSTGPCVPAGIQFAVFGFYLDNCDLKKNGKPKLKQTNQVTVNVVPNLADCNPCFCFGQEDDGAQDGTIWKVQNPAQSKDYFNTNFGGQDPVTGNSCIANSVTSVQIASWDFCGTGTTTGPSWASVGLYEGSTVDPQGTPDLSAVIASATTLSFPVNAAQFGYPATTYDFPDVFVSTSSALANMANGHVAAKWPTGDTCIWMGSDTDGVDDDATATGTCSAIPSTNSYFTANGYSTTGIQFTATNWLMKIDWN